MSDIQTYLRQILDAVYGEEVRNSIHDAISTMNSDLESAIQDDLNPLAFKGNLGESGGTNNNLNNLIQTDQRGIWRLLGGTTYTNVPSDFVNSKQAYLIMYAFGTSGSTATVIKQEIHYFSDSGANANMSWSRVYLSGEWQPWHKNVDNTLSIEGAAADSKSVGDLSSGFGNAKYFPLIDASRPVGSSNPAVVNNGDGSYTLNTTGHGRILWGKNGSKVHLKPGLYVLYGVPDGYSFIAKEHELSGLVGKNYSLDPACIRVEEEDDYYIGHRMDSNPSTSFTIWPSLFKSIGGDNQDKIDESMHTIDLLKHDVHELTASLNWEVGGIAVDTGKNYDAQKNRIRTPYLYTDKDLTVVQNEVVQGYSVWYGVFMWNAYNPTGNCDTVVQPIRLPQEYTIPKNTYFRILVASANLSTDIQDIYDSVLYRSIKIVDSDGYDLLQQMNVTVPKLSDNANAVMFDALDAKSQLMWEVGGINNDTGKDYNAQTNRIRTAGLRYTDRDLIICRGDNVTEYPYDYRVHFWDDGDYSHSKTSDSGWIRLPAEYTIPAGSYFRIVINAGGSYPVITDVVNSSMFKAFNITNKRGKVLNDYIYGLSSSAIDGLNAEMKPFVQSLKKSYPPNAKSVYSQQYSPLSILHFSDIHRKQELWKRIMDYADANSSYIDFALHTGDYCDADQSSYTDLYAVQTPESVVVYNCIGNHDAYITMEDGINPDKSVAYNKLFNHTSGWDVTYEQDINYSMTYYKDFTESNIRLIVLDNYYDVQQQCVWLANVMNDAKERGLSVVTAAHQLTAPPSEKVDATFQTLMPFSWIATTDFDAVIGTAIQNGCNHIVHLAGHEHTDWFYRTANGVLNCAVECATTYLGWTEGDRVANTKSMDCFNVTAIDTELHTIKIARIGHNTDSYNREKNVLSYDYANDEVLWNG